MADFVFADDYRLEKGSTRSFYEMFLKGLVHKHNNLMGVIQGFSSLILYDDSINAEVRDSAQQMQDTARVASDLNQQVLTSAGIGRVEEETVDLAGRLAYWRSKAEEICAAAGVSVQANFREDLPPVRADGNKLNDVVIPLLQNAAEAAAGVGGGSVAIDIFPPGEASPGNTVDLFIRNSSEELDAAALEKAFEPFHTTKGSEHFGIGLTAAAVLAGEMGVRLGLRYAEATTTAWLSIPPAE